MNAKELQKQIETLHVARKVYIVTKSTCPMIGSEELQLMHVPLDQEAAFIKEYEGRILVSADSVQEAFMKFNEYKKG